MPQARVWTIDGYHVSGTVSGAGPPMVFVPGMGSDRREFRLLRPPISHHFTFHSLDFLGAGASDKPLRLYPVELYVEQLVQLLAIEDLRDVVLVGESFGATVVA